MRRATVGRRPQHGSGRAGEAPQRRCDSLRRKGRGVSRNGDPIDLSSKEFMLLQLLIENQGQILSRAFIAERVWDVKYEGESNVVDVNIRRLRAKLDDPYPQKLIQTVRGRGYVIR